MGDWTPGIAFTVGDTFTYHPRGPRGGKRKPVRVEVVETFPHEPILTPAERAALASMAGILRDRNQGYGKRGRK